MVAASSYQKDGRAAPPRLIAAASTPTISGSSAAGGECKQVAAKRTAVMPRLAGSGDAHRATKQIGVSLEHHRYVARRQIRAPVEQPQTDHSNV